MLRWLYFRESAEAKKRPMPGIHNNACSLQQYIYIPCKGVFIIYVRRRVKNKASQQGSWTGWGRSDLCRQRDGEHYYLFFAEEEGQKTHVISASKFMNFVRPPFKYHGHSLMLVLWRSWQSIHHSKIETISPAKLITDLANVVLLNTHNYPTSILAPPRHAKRSENPYDLLAPWWCCCTMIEQLFH